MARKWYPTVTARAGEDLAAKIAEQDQIAYDRGWVRISASEPRTVLDVTTVDLVYEQARAGTDVARRADALAASQPQRASGPPWALIIIVLIILLVLGVPLFTVRLQ